LTSKPDKERITAAATEKKGRKEERKKGNLKPISLMNKESY
jgi:hypothetical protein